MELQILVVDDDPQVLRLFSKILTKGGYTVSTESSSKKAVTQVMDKNSPFDLLVLDISMPKPDGLEILRAVRTQRPGLRTLVVSGFLDGALLEAAKCLGATETILKTDAPKLLLRQVDRLLKE